MTRLLLACAAALILASPAGAADRPWTAVQGRSLMAMGQQSPSTLTDIVVELEQFRAAVGRLIRGAERPPSIPTLMFVFDDRKASEPFLPLYNGKPASVAGYCQCSSASEASVMVVTRGEYRVSAKILYHEYTHLLVRNAALAVPVWLSEGLAEFYSTFRLTGNGARAQLGWPIEESVALLQHDWLPVEQVLGVTTGSTLYNERLRRSTFYAVSWAMTHYLLVERPDGPAALNRYLGILARGGSGVPAFEQAFGISPSTLDNLLKAYVSRPTLPTQTATYADRIAVPAPGPARTVPPGEAQARLGELQLRVGRDDEATKRIEAAAVAAPDELRPQLALALLRMGQGRGDEAIAAAQRASRIGPADYLTQYTLGLALLKGHFEQTADDEVLEAAHEALAHATAANAEAPDAWSWLAFVDLALDTRLDEARAAMRRAVDLAPGRMDLRVRQATVLVRVGALEEALTALQVIIASGEPSSVAEARRLYIQAARAQRALDLASRSALPSEEPPAPPPSSSDVLVARYRDGVAEPGQAPLMLRHVNEGEQRASGDLVEIRCAPDRVTLHVRRGDDLIVVQAPSLGAVSMTQFVSRPGFTVACGTRIPADAVYVTWRPGSGLGPGVVGTAVALEFVPPTARKQE